MATRLIGTDDANPRLPAVVIAATQGTTADDFAPGNILDGFEGGGGGGPVVALTQAEYIALDPPDPDTVYVITDATAAADPLTVGTLHTTGGAEIDGNLDHDGTFAGFYGAAVTAKPTSVTARVALQTLGLGATLAADPDFAGTDTTLTGTNTTLAVAPASLNFALGRQLLNDQTGTTYTLVYADAGKLVTLSNASAVTLTVPPAASVPFEVGTHIDLAQLGVGQVTVAAGAGVTVNGTPGLKARARYSRMRLEKLTTANTWLLSGDSSA